MQRKLVATITLASLLMVTGCSTDTTISSSTAINTSTGQVTETVTVTETIHLGGAKPKSQFIVSGGESPSDSTGIQLTQEVPAPFVPISSTNSTVTLTAQTDTGFVSSITVSLQPTTTSLSPINPSDAMYAWYVQDSPALDAWQQSVENNASDVIVVTTSSPIAYSYGSQIGAFSVISSLQIPSVTDVSSASSSGIILGGGGITKCPNKPGCPVQPSLPPE